MVEHGRTRGRAQVGPVGPVGRGERPLELVDRLGAGVRSGTGVAQRRDHIGDPRPRIGLDELRHAPAGRALVAEPGRIRPRSDRGPDAVGAVVDLEVQPVEGPGAAVLEQAHGGLDDIAVVGRRRLALEPSLLEGDVAGAERRHVLGADADLRVVEAVRPVLGVAGVEEDLERVLDPRVGAAHVGRGVGHLREDVQRVGAPERPDERRRAAGALNGDVGRDGVRERPDAVDLAVDRRWHRRRDRLRVRERLDEGERPHRALLVPADGGGCRR